MIAVEADELRRILRHMVIASHTVREHHCRTALAVIDRLVVDAETLAAQRISKCHTCSAQIVQAYSGRWYHEWTAMPWCPQKAGPDGDS